MKKYSIIFVLFCLLNIHYFSGCHEDNKKSDNIINDNNGDEEKVKKYINFRVTCGSPSQGRLVDVGIFDQVTGILLFFGYTQANGNFYSISTFDVSGVYRIELYEYQITKCYMWIKNITYQDNPMFWCEHQFDTPKATLHLGGDCNNIPTAAGCWQ